MSFFKKIKGKLKEYQEEAPMREERRAGRLEQRRERESERLEHQLKTESLKTKISHTRASGQTVKLGIQQKRQNLTQQRQQSMGTFPDPFGFSKSPLPSPGAVPRAASPKKRKAKPKAKPRKRKR